MWDDSFEETSEISSLNKTLTHTQNAYTQQKNQEIHQEKKRRRWTETSGWTVRSWEEKQKKNQEDIEGDQEDEKEKHRATEKKQDSSVDEELNRNNNNEKRMAEPTVGLVEQMRIIQDITSDPDTYNGRNSLQSFMNYDRMQTGKRTGR